MSHNLSPKVKIFGVVFQNNQGLRFYSKYYLRHFSQSFLSRLQFNIDDPHSQKRFENELLSKAKKMNVISAMKPDATQIFSYKNVSVLFKVLDELQIYLICDEEQNNVLMQSVIDCIGNTLQLFTKEKYSGKIIYDNLDNIILTADQIIDEGIIVTMDPDTVCGRVKMRDGKQAGTDNKKPGESIPAQQQQGGTFSSIFGFAKNSLSKTLNFG